MTHIFTPSGGLNEDARQAHVDREANRLAEKYGDRIHDLRSADIFAVSGKQFNEHDAYYVGTMMERFEQFVEMAVHETGSASDLGVLPNLALDAIASSYGMGVAPLLASHQPLEEEVGNVYFKELIFESTRNGATKGDTYMQSDQGMAAANHDKMYNFGTTLIEDEDSGEDTTATGRSISVTASLLPLRKSKVVLKIDTLDWTFTDDGAGNMVGTKGGGTVNYATGVIAVELNDDPGGTHNILITYEQDIELADDLPTIGSQYTSKSVNAYVVAFKGLVESLKSFSMRRRFGKILEDDVIQDLSEAMSAARSSRAISQLKLAFLAGGATAKTFTKVNPNVGTIEETRYRQGLQLAIEDANLDLRDRSGNGSINRMVCGKNMASFLMAQDGFTKVEFDESLGPILLGTLGTISVVYAPGQIADDEVICLYNSPTSPFKSAIVIATYMPMFMTNLLPHSNNPLRSQRAVAEWSAYETLVPRYTHKVALI